MILEALLSIVRAFVVLLLTPINFPSLPEAVTNILLDQTFTGAISSGFSIIASYTHWSFISGLFLSVMAFRVIELLYKWICWVLRKIPVLNVRG